MIGPEEMIAKKLYEHWRRFDRGPYLGWEEASPELKRVFREKAEVAFGAYLKWDELMQSE